MTLLVIGLLLWSTVHLIPSAGMPLKQAWVKKLGENGYAGSFALLIVGSMLLIIFGWRSAPVSSVYVPPEALKPLTAALMAPAIMLFVAAKHPTRLRRIVRHPQMTFVVVWSMAHLIQNGDSRSIVLFGGLSVWAILEIVFINRRDGAWVKADVPSVSVDARYLLISLVVYAIVVLIHPYISGSVLIKL